MPATFFFALIFAHVRALFVRDPFQRSYAMLRSILPVSFAVFGGTTLRFVAAHRCLLSRVGVVRGTNDRS